jgi:hypothetical protein
VPRKDTVGIDLARRPRLLGTFDGRKIEAVTLLRGGDGGWVLER